MQITQLASNVLTVTMDIELGWSQWFMLSSDRHRDNKFCDIALERKHLEIVKKRNAKIFDFGDMHCAMQGKWDRRADQNQLPDDLRGNNYLNLLTDYMENAYKNYKNQFALIIPGNHETAILKHHQYDLIGELGKRMEWNVGTYAGWIKFIFKYKTKYYSKLLYYNHGYGGGGPVTKGVIQTNRMTAYLANADIVVTGHTHDQWIMPLTRACLTHQNTPKLITQYHVKCGGYKEEFLCGEGYHAEGGRPPKPLGAVWLKFSVEPGNLMAGDITIELSLAN